MYGTAGVFDFGGIRLASFNTPAVFENFVQAKRELIKEGYRKDNLNNVDFNEIFEQTKKKMLEEKVKSLKRENEMLKEKLNFLTKKIKGY